MSLSELHSHLYGALNLEDIQWLAQRNPPRKEYFERSYELAYNARVNWQGLFENTPAARKRLANYYYFRTSGPFAKFQASFDLIIAISQTDRNELEEIMQRVLQREPANYAEYRMMFSPSLSITEFKTRVQDLCSACTKANASHQNKKARIVISLLRHPQIGLQQYKALRELQQIDPDVQQMLVGLDFCAVEEGNPLHILKNLIQKIHADNRNNPDHFLAILYHVGESFTDKSVESAVRWVIEAATAGCHRLGHAIALGVNPRLYLNTTRLEIRAERIRQLQFELLHSTNLQHSGYEIDADKHQQELQSLLRYPDGAPVHIEYNDFRIEQLKVIQEWAMQYVRQSEAIIESCPTSNLRIGQLKNSDNHPLRRFLKAGLSVVIGSDDPGILETDLKQEFDSIAGWSGVDQQAILSMQACARQSHSRDLGQKA